MVKKTEQRKMNRQEAWRLKVQFLKKGRIKPHWKSKFKQQLEGGEAISHLYYLYGED